MDVLGADLLFAIIAWVLGLAFVILVCSLALALLLLWGAIKDIWDDIKIRRRLDDL